MGDAGGEWLGAPEKQPNCDMIHDKDSGNACDGPKVVVASSGLATVIVGAKDAVAFTRADRISNVN